MMMAARLTLRRVTLIHRAHNAALRVGSDYASGAKHEQQSDETGHLRITVSRSKRLGARLLLRGPDANLKNYEFRRVNGSNTHNDHQPSVVDIALRHRRGVAGDEVSLVLLPALQGTLQPLACEETVNR